jgi:hypothetical protein
VVGRLVAAGVELFTISLFGSLVFALPYFALLELSVKMPEPFLPIRPEYANVLLAQEGRLDENLSFFPCNRVFARLEENGSPRADTRAVGDWATPAALFSFGDRRQ